MSREATQFQKGQSGNPGGRPKRKLITDALLAELKTTVGRGQRTRAEQLARRLVRLACAGDVAAAKLILAYTEGAPAQQLTIQVRDAARRIAAQTGAPEDWLIRRAEEIAALAEAEA